MHNGYDDIRERINEPPKWWDENAVPRYCDFSPKETANIYADEAALVLIGCQNCGREFMVCFSCSQSQIMMAKARGYNARTLADQIKDKTIHYGDPPNADCCAAGATMNCDDLRVFEYWHRPDHFDWVRDSFLETDVSDIPETAETK